MVFKLVPKRKMLDPEKDPTVTQLIQEQSSTEMGSSVSAQASGKFYRKLIIPYSAKFEYYWPGVGTGSTGDNPYQTYWWAGTFTPTETHRFNKATLRLQRVGSPGVLIVSLRATSGAHPTGSDLCVGYLNGNNLTTSFVTYKIFMTTSYEIASGTKYAIVFRAPASNSSNYVQARYQHSGTYGGGNVEYSPDGSSWTSYTTYDLLFEEWGVGSSDKGSIWIG